MTLVVVKFYSSYRESLLSYCRIEQNVMRSCYKPSKTLSNAPENSLKEMIADE